MELKLKGNYADTVIFIPQENQNILGKFIDVRLYPHLYKLYPDLFEVVEPVKEIKKTKLDDISVDNTTKEDSSSK